MPLASPLSRARSRHGPVCGSYYPQRRVLGRCRGKLVANRWRIHSSWESKGMSAGTAGGDRQLARGFTHLVRERASRWAWAVPQVQGTGPTRHPGSAGEGVVLFCAPAFRGRGPGLGRIPNVQHGADVFGLVQVLLNLVNQGRGVFDRRRQAHVGRPELAVVAVVTGLTRGSDVRVTTDGPAFTCPRMAVLVNLHPPARGIGATKLHFERGRATAVGIKLFVLLLPRPPLFFPDPPSNARKGQRAA